MLEEKEEYTLEEYLTKDENGITFLESILKEGKKPDYKEEKKLLKSIEACYLYVKYNNSLFDFELTEEELYSHINGDLLINHIFNSNCAGISSIIKKINNNTFIIDKIIESGKTFLLSYLTKEIKEKLITIDQNGEYLIEKYFNDLDIIKELIGLYKNPIDIIKICEEKNKLEILKYSNEDALMNKINDDETLLDYLLSKNIIPEKLIDISYNENFIKFLASRNMYSFMKNINSEFTLNIEIENNKTLLEVLFDKGMIKELDIYIQKEKTIEVLYRLNKLDLITTIHLDLLIKECKEFNINSNNTLVEYLLDNNYKFKFYDSFSSNMREETNLLIDKLYKRKEFDIISKSIEPKYLSYEIEPGITLLDKLLEEKVDINFGYLGINKIETIEKMFNKNRLDLLVKAKLDLLLNIVNNNDTYLDYLLEAIETKKIKFNLNDFSLYNCSVNTIAKFYLKIASHGMMEYVNELKEKDLLKEYEGKRLLDELIDLDKELTLNKILTDDMKSNVKIASILKSKGINLENINVPLKEKDFTSNYLKEEHNKFGIGPLQQNGDNLLNKLQNLFLNDGESDKEIIEALITGYRQALINNYDVFIKEVENLIEIKENNKEFRYLKEENSGYFSRNTGSVHCDDINIDTLMHETGHALHYYLTDYKVPENFEEIINEIRNNKEILKNAEIISNKYYLIKENIMKLVNVKYNNYFKECYNVEKNNEIIDFLLKSKEEKKQEFKGLGINDDDLDIILNETFTSEEYIKTQKRLFIKEQVDVIIREEYGNIMAVSDILDGIFEGELNSGFLENDNNGLIKRSAGHGISYYSCKPDLIFMEMIANFSSISKSPKASEGLKLLKDTIGDELYNLISEFYYNNIIYKQEEKSKSL